MNKKKVYIIEYDDSGTEIDRNLLVDNDSLRNLFLMERYAVNKRFLLDLNYRNLFNSDQWDFIENFSDIIKIYKFTSNDKFAYAEISEDDIEFLENLFNSEKELLDIIIKLRYNNCPAQSSFWILSPKGHPSISYNNKSLRSIYDWIKNRNGIYYAINTNGSKTWDYIDRPTKKQALYQRRKGRRIAFLSFRDFKEYIIDNDDLSETKI